MITFNRPYTTKDELRHIQQVIVSGHFSGNGHFSKACQDLLLKMTGVAKCLLTNSCTSALELSALLLNIQPGDEVIVPSYTFVSTANAFGLRGAKLVLADSRKDHPGMDEDKVEALITEKTKAIVPVHYAGVSCDMEKLLAVAKAHELKIVEDAAQCIDSTFTFKSGEQSALGTIGDLGALSFHDTKNVQCG